jgi:beta-N-acetylhexosaminidase
MPRKRRLAAVLVLAAAMAAPGAEKYERPSAVRLDRDGEKWAEKTLGKLTLEQKIGQMFLIWARAGFVNVNSAEYRELRDTIRKYHIGALGMTVPWEPPFLYKKGPYEAAMLLNQLQRDAELPLLVAADFERGLAMRLNGVTDFPHPMAFGAAGKPEYAEAFGRITAQEARAIGVQWNFFPVADVNSNPLNPIINTRSFGEDPQQVGEMVAAYIRGARAYGLLTTAKHFPGHGDTDTDSHLNVARVGGDLERLQTVELAPFQKAIAAGVDAVMVAHVSVPALEPDPNVVASTSPRIVTGLLKDQMGFTGLVVTDAMDMNGLMRLYAASGNPSGAAAVAAVKAGNDMLLIPEDLDGAYNGLLNAVRSGEIPQAQIDAAVLKILKMKASVGLNRSRLVDPEMLDKVVADPQNVAFGQQVANEAVTLVRENGLLPLKRSVGTPEGGNAYSRVEAARNRVVAVIFTDDVRTEAGRALERELRARVPDANIFYVDPRTAGALSEQVLAAAGQAQAVVAAVDQVATAGARNAMELNDASGALLHAILQRVPQHTAVLALGNPYLGSEFPEALNYLCTFSNEPVSEASAVRALFGEIAVHGRLPVTIPGMAQRGSGLDRPQTAGGLTSHEPHPKP